MESGMEFLDLGIIFTVLSGKNTNFAFKKISSLYYYCSIVDDKILQNFNQVSSNENCHK
jgi:hypothetical protein